MDDALSSSIIDSLSEFCKTRLTTSSNLEIVNNEDTTKLLNKLKDGITIDMDTLADNSVFWSAVVYAFRDCPIHDFVSDDLENVMHDLSDGYKRACGPFLCTAEFLVEEFPGNATTVVTSLFTALVPTKFIDQGKSAGVLLNVLQDYKSYFPYTYTFCRRLGRSPNFSMDDWKKCLFGDVLTSHATHLQTAEVTPATTSNPWDVMTFEEDDSDDEKADFIRPTPLVVKASPRRKRVTRMSSSNKSKDKNISNAKNTENTRILDTSIITDDLDDSMEILDISLLNDSNTTASPPDKNNSNKFYKNNETTVEKFEKNNTFSSISDMKSDDPDYIDNGYKVISVNALRSTFQSLLSSKNDVLVNTHDLANSVKKLTPNSVSVLLEQIIIKFHDDLISWDELYEISKSYLSEDRKMSDNVVSYDSSSVDSTKKWSDEGLYNRGNNNKNLYQSYNMNNSADHQTSPYLSIHQPPPSQNISQIGELLFKDLDIYNSGVVTKRNIINAIQKNSFSIAEKISSISSDHSINKFISQLEDFHTRNNEKITINEFLDFVDYYNNNADTLNSTSSIRNNTGEFQANSLNEKDKTKSKYPVDSWSLANEALSPMRISTSSNDIIHFDQEVQQDKSVLDTSSDRILDVNINDINQNHFQNDFRSNRLNQSMVRRRQENGQLDSIDSIDKGDVGIASNSGIIIPSSPKLSNIAPRNSNSQLEIKENEIPESSNKNENVNIATAISNIRASTNRPPLARSFSGTMSSSHNLLRDSISSLNNENTPVIIDRDFHVNPPIPSEFGCRVNTILEGYLEKKGSLTGFYQKRYYVIAFRGNPFTSTGDMNFANIELRMFNKCVESAWGNVPIHLKKVIPISAITSVEAISNKKKIESIFTITHKLSLQAPQSPNDMNGKSSTTINVPQTDAINLERKDSADSILSDAMWTGKETVLTLRAPNPETRLLWITTLQKAMKIAV